MKLRRGHPRRLWIVVLLLAPFSGGLAKEKLPVREIRPGGRGKGVTVLPLGKAVEAMREHYRPVLVFHDGGTLHREKDRQFVADWERLLVQRSSRKVLRLIVLSRVSTADLVQPWPSAESAGGQDAPTTAAYLGLLSGAPALLLLDFRGRVRKRVDGSLPSGARLRRMIASFVVRNEALARYARRTEKVLEQSRYAYRLGKKRTAIQKVLPLENPRERKKMDPVLLQRVTDVIKTYRDDVRKLLRKGNDLDDRKQYARALIALEKIAKDYPFPDVIRETNRKRGDILRKAQLGI